MKKDKITIEAIEALKELSRESGAKSSVWAEDSEGFIITLSVEPPKK